MQIEIWIIMSQKNIISNKNIFYQLICTSLHQFAPVWMVLVKNAGLIILTFNSSFGKMKLYKSEKVEKVGEFFQRRVWLRHCMNFI